MDLYMVLYVCLSSMVGARWFFAGVPGDLGPFLGRSSCFFAPVACRHVRAQDGPQEVGEGEGGLRHALHAALQAARQVRGV